MPFLHVAPLLLYSLIGILLGLLAWGILMSRGGSGNGIWPDAPDHLRFWLLLLAVFSLGAFVAFTLEAWLFFK
jgi:hypothetical protein